MSLEGNTPRPTVGVAPNDATIGLNQPLNYGGTTTSSSDTYAVPAPPEKERVYGDDEDVDEDGEAADPPGILQRIMPTGGVLASGFSFSAASMGAGTLGLPAAMLAAGSVMGSLMLVLVCISTVYSIRLLAITVEKTGFMTYESMSAGLVGHKFEKLTAFLIVMFCWGCTVTYVVVAGDVMEKLSGISWWPTALKGTGGGRIMTIIYWACFMLPLSLAREINSLRYASTLGVVSTIILVTSIVIHSANATGPDGTVSASKNLTYFEFDINMVVAMPTFIFSYCCQTNAFEIYTEMKPRTVKQMTKNCSVSMIICTTIYIIAGVAGFANFGTETDANILNNLNPLSEAYLSVAFFAVTITMTACFPICIFPTRDAVLQVIGYPSAYDCPTYVRVLVCLGLSVGSLVLGLFIPDIQVLFGVLGGICGSSLAFIWPAVFYVKGLGAGQFNAQNVGMGNIIGVWLLIIVGAIAGILGTTVSLYQTITA